MHAWLAICGRLRAHTAREVQDGWFKTWQYGYNGAIILATQDMDFLVRWDYFYRSSVQA